MLDGIPRTAGEDGAALPRVAPRRRSAVRSRLLTDQRQGGDASPADTVKPTLLFAHLATELRSDATVRAMLHPGAQLIPCRYVRPFK